MEFRHDFLILLFIVFFISGCSHTVIKQQEFSGFISSYSNLVPEKLPSGTTMLHWKNKSLRKGQYSKIILDPTVFYPEPQVNDNVSAEILNTIKTKVDQRLHELAKLNQIEVTTKPGRKVLRVRSAFTSIKVSNEAFTALDLLPVKLIIDTAVLSVGERDQDVTMIHEFEIIDSLSNEPMIKGIRKGKTLQLANKNEKLTMEFVKPLMKKWDLDINESFRHFAKIVSGN